MTTSYQAIKRTLSILFCLGLFIAIASCSGDDGDTGPQGEQGAKGDKGDTGAAGADALAKNGYIDGTVTGTRQDGTAFTETFKYEYRGDITILDDDDFYVYRNSDLGDDSQYIEIDGSIANAGTPQQTVTPTYFRLEFIKEISVNTLFRLDAWFYNNEGNSADVTITNYSYNATTGVLTFNYSFTGDGTDDNSTGKPITITGSFNSGTSRVYDGVVGRKGN